MDDTPPRPAVAAAERAFVAKAILRLAALGDGISADLADSGLDATVINNSSVTTLLLLAESGPTRPVDLAGRAGMTTGGMTKVIDRLVDHGLVTRSTEGVSDGRGVLVDLTATGAGSVERLCAVTYPTVRQGLDDLISLRSEDGRP